MTYRDHVPLALFKNTETGASSAVLLLQVALLMILIVSNVITNPGVNLT